MNLDKLDETITTKDLPRADDALERVSNHAREKTDPILQQIIKEINNAVNDGKVEISININEEFIDLQNIGRILEEKGYYIDYFGSSIRSKYRLDVNWYRKNWITLKKQQEKDQKDWENKYSSKSLFGKLWMRMTTAQPKKKMNIIIKM